VLSSPPVTVSTTEIDSVVRVGGGASVVSRTTQRPWWRETVVVPGPKASLDQIHEWIKWYQDEPNWVDWALSALSLPPVEVLFLRDAT
jgi:hypothetical protein